VTAWLITTLVLLVGGIACLAHADSGETLAIIGWVLIAVALITLSAALPADDE